jgi:putative heme iron utilization protein
MSRRAREARRLLNNESVGVLSTHSVDLPGYPFGSIVPYVVGHDGALVILISDIAQHTKNIAADPRVSLTVFERRADDVQAAGRVTWVGEAAPLDRGDTASRRRYARGFPASDGFFETHGFAFYRIGLRRARYIGGFGEIFWVAADELLLANPFGDAEAGIVEHMNVDHEAALRHYCRRLAGLDPAEVAMTGIDAEGFDMLADGRKVRIDFDEPIATSEEARRELVRLARL